jgi:glycosyltransferase involved in cell wall biosynthesis
MAALVSVIIPTYNRAHLVGAAVESILAQTWRPMQVVVVDDGSKDETPAVMAALESKVRAASVEPVFIRKENGGVASARNAGLRAATGDYVGFLDDDDVWLPEKTAKQMAALEASGADACSALAIEMRVDGEHTIPSPPETLFEGFNPAAFMLAKADCNLNTMLVAKHILAKVGEFDGSLTINEDLEWKMRLVHEASFCSVNEVFMRISFTPGSLSRFKGYAGLVKRDELREKALLRIRESCSMRKGFDDAAWRSRAAKAYDQFVKHRLYGGEVSVARDVWRRGMELTQGLAPLPRLKRKLLKARLLSLIGMRMKHPSLRSVEDFAA